MNAHYFKLGTGPTIDEQSGTIRHVSLMEIGNAEGHFDKNGRQMIVDATTLRQVYEYCVKNGNLKVKADHGSGVMATIGWADNFALTANKVTADFHIYETEPQRPRIIEMARKNPDHLGMSLEFNGDDEVKGDTCLARCESVFATALVSDPAANKSLFSAIPPETNENQNTQMDTKQFEELSKKIDTLQATNESQADLIKKFAKKFEDDEAKKKELEDDDEAKKKELEDDDDKKDMDDEPDDDDDDADDDDADDDKKKKKKDDEKELTKKIEMAAKRGAEAAIKAFSAKMGIVQLKTSAAGDTGGKEKHFEEYVADLAHKEFDGDSKKARVKILTNMSKYQEASKAYAAQRNVKTA